MACISFAQDYHYWSEQFGTRSSMMGGALFGGTDDNSTLYYNGAAQAFLEKNTLSVSINTYRVRNIKVLNAHGQGIDQKSTKFKTYPNLIAGMFKFKDSSNWRLGYIGITKTMYKNDYNILVEKNIDVLSQFNGNEQYIGGYNYLSDIQEYWAGLNLSYKILPKWSVGLTHFFSFRDFKYSNFINVNALPENNALSSYSEFTSSIDMAYWHFKGIVRLSTAYQSEKFRIGINFTFKSYNIYGEAKVYREFSVQNLPESIPFDVTFKDREDQVKAQHRYPGSLSIGTSFKMAKKHWIHFGTEFFFGTKEYYVINSEKYPSRYPTAIDNATVDQIFGNQSFLDFKHQSNPVWNAGLGFDFQLTEKVHLLMGGRTDFLHQKNSYFLLQKIGVESSKWSLFHVSSGVTFITKKDKKVSVGLEYAITPQKKIYSSINFDQPRSNNFLLSDPTQNAVAKQFALKLLFSIELFGEKKHDSTN